VPSALQGSPEQPCLTGAWALLSWLSQWPMPNPQAGRIFSCLFLQLKESFLSNCRHQVVRKTIAVFLDHFFTSITNAFLFSPEISFHLPIFCKVVDRLANPSVLHPSLYLQSLSIQDSAYCFMKQSISHFPLNININIIDLSHKSF